MPPALLILFQVLAGLLLGALGVVLAAPLLAVLVVAMKMLYVEDVLGDHPHVPGDPQAGPPPRIEKKRLKLHAPLDSTGGAGIIPGLRTTPAAGGRAAGGRYLFDVPEQTNLKVVLIPHPGGRRCLCRRAPAVCPRSKPLERRQLMSGQREDQLPAAEQARPVRLPRR